MRARGEKQFSHVQDKCPSTVLSLLTQLKFSVGATPGSAQGLLLAEIQGSYGEPEIIIESGLLYARQVPKALLQPPLLKPLYLGTSVY